MTQFYLAGAPRIIALKVLAALARMAAAMLFEYCIEELK